MRYFTPLAASVLVVVATLSMSKAVVTVLREIAITVTFKTRDNTPLTNSTFTISTTQGEYTATTDQDGLAVFKAVAVDEADTRLPLKLGSTTKDADEQRAIASHWRELRSEYYLPILRSIEDGIAIDIDQERNEYSLELIAQPAVALSGRLVNEVGQAAKGYFVTIRYASMVGVAIDRTGHFRLAGVAKGKANEMFINTYPYVFPIEITAEQVSADLDLGDIKIADRPIVEATGSADIRCVDSVSRGAGVMLVSEDAKFILSFSTTPEGSVYTGLAKDFNGDPLELPVGHYYVAPGKFLATALNFGLLDAIRVGVNLNDSGIPKMTIEDGKRSQLEFKADEVAQAIRAVMAKMAEPAKPE